MEYIILFLLGFLISPITISILRMYRKLPVKSEIKNSIPILCHAQKCERKIKSQTYIRSLSCSISLISIYYSATNIPYESSIEFALMMIIFILMGFASVSDIEWKEADYIFTISIALIGTAVSFSKFGWLGILYSVSVFTIFELIAIFFSDSIGGADIFIYTGLCGCFKIQSLGLLLLIPALIAIALYVVDLKLSKVLATEEGIALIPSIMSGIVIIQYIETSFF